MIRNRSYLSWHVYHNAFARVYYHLAERPLSSILLVWLYILFDWLQLLLLFPLNTARQLPWAKAPIMRNFLEVSDVLMLAPTDTSEFRPLKQSSIPASNLFIAAAAFCAILWSGFIAISIYHSNTGQLEDEEQMATVQRVQRQEGRVSFSSSNKKGASSLSSIAFEMLSNPADVRDDLVLVQVPDWVMRFLSALTSLGRYALIAPITLILMTPLNCNGYWRTSVLGGEECMTGGHLVFFILAIILLPLWILWSVFTAAVVINPFPDFEGKFNPFGVAHGRVEVGMVIVKVIMCIARVFGNLLTPWVYAVLVTLCGIAWLALYVYYLPFYNQLWNRIQAAAACTYLSCCIGLFIGLGLGDNNNEASALGVFILLPVSLYVGYSMAAIRFRAVGTYTELTSPYLVELRARYVLHEGLMSLGSGSSSNLFAADTPISSSDKLTTAMDYTEAGILNKAAVTQNLNSISQVQETNANRFGSKDAKDCVRSTIREMDKILRSGCQLFPNSAVMNLFYASFQSYFRKNKHLERVFLRHAHNHSENLSNYDVNFFVFQRVLNIFLDNLGNNTTALTVDRRMAYEHLLALSKGQTDECRQLVSQFWGELTHRNPDLRQLRKLGARIVHVLRITNQTYLRLLDLAPQSASLMRLYAGFLLELANDPQQAQEYLQDAETMEDEQAKLIGSHIDAEVDFGGVPSEFDLAAEGISWIRVSADDSSLGIIQDVNSEFLKLYGYTRRELIGKEMSFLTPEPICSLHPYFLRKYQLLGEEKVSNRNCFGLAQHRSGHCVPVRINIRPAGHEYITILEEVRSPFAYMLFLGENYNYRITAMCKFAATILRTEPSQLNLKGNVGVSLRSFVEEDIFEFFQRADAEEGYTTLVLAGSPTIAKLQRMKLNFLDCDLHILRFRLSGSNEDTHSPSYGSHDDFHSQISGDASSGAISEHANSLEGNTSFHGEVDRASFAGSQLRPNPHALPAKSNEPVVFRSDTNMRYAKGKNVSLALPGQIPPGHEDHFNGDMNMCPFLSGNGGGSKDKGEPKIPFRPGSDAKAETDGTRSLALSQDSEDDDIMRILDGDEPAQRSVVHAPSSVSIPNPGSPSVHAASYPTDAQLIDEESRRYRLDTGSTQLTPQFPPQHPHFRMSTQHPMQSSILADSSNGYAHERASSVSFPTLPDNSNSEPARQVTIQSDVEHMDGTRLRDSTARFGTIEERMVPQLMRGSKVSDGANLIQDVWDDDYPQKTAGSRKNGDDSKNRHVSMAKSVRSGTSYSSNSSGMTLRKGIRSQAERLENSLLTLKAAILSVFALIAFLNIICVLVSRLQFEKAEIDIHNISDNGLRMIYLSRAATSIQDLQLIQGGRLTSADNFTEQHIRDRLIKLVEKTEDMHRHLYMSLDARDKEENWVYKDPHILVRDLIPGTFVDKLQWEYLNRTTNLVNLGLEISAKMRLVHSNPYANLTDPNSWFLWYNIPNSYIPALNASMVLAGTHTELKVELVHLSNVVVSAVALFTLVAVILLVIVPSISSVVESRNRVFNIFLELRPGIFRRLRNQVQKKIDALAKEAAGEELNPEDIPDPTGVSHTDDGKDGTGSVMSRFTLTRDSTSHKDDLDDEDDEDDENYSEGVCDSFLRLICCRSKKVDNAGKRKREFQHASSSHSLLIIQVIWPLLCYGAFYLVMFFTRDAAITQSRNYSEEVFWSRQNEIHTSLANVMVREAMGSCEPNVIYYVLSQADISVAAIEYIQDAILYGNSALKVRSGLQKNPEIYRIALENACFDDAATYDYTYEECMEEFHHGIFANGAQQAMQEYLSLMRELIRARREVFWATYLAYMSGDTSLALQLCLTGSNFVDWRLPIVDSMSWKFLAAALHEISTSIIRANSHFFNAYYTMDISVTICSILMLFVFYVTVYRPRIKRLDGDIKEVRHLLLLLPDEIAAKSTGILLYEEDLLKTDRGSVRGCCSFLQRQGSN